MWAGVTLRITIFILEFRVAFTFQPLCVGAVSGAPE